MQALHFMRRQRFLSMLVLTAALLPAAAIAAEWKPWAAHAAECSTTCGEGVRCRQRSCVDSADKRKEVNVDSCTGGEKASRECLPCRAYVECPVNGGWGWWTEWTECQLQRNSSSGAVNREGSQQNDEGKALAALEQNAEMDVNSQTHVMDKPAHGDLLDLDAECGKGTRTRERSCDHPPPGPSGLLCGEDSGRLQSENCTIPCTADLNYLDVVKEILAVDLMTSPNQLVYVNFGAPVVLECANDAYALAQEAVQPYQLLQIQWRRNNVSVTVLVTQLERFVQRVKEAKGMLSTPANDALKGKVETSQLRSIGTQLTIDPVDANQVGVYGCYMVLDGEHYLMRSFTLLSRQLTVHQAMETELTNMQSNTETFINDQLPAMELAMVRWYHNGMPNREHMLVDWQERNWKLPLGYRETGVWECYISLGQSQWKTNEFKLLISQEASFFQKFDNTYGTYFLATCAMIMYAVVGFPLAVVTLRQREDNFITAEEQRCIEFVRQINYLYMARYVRNIS